MGFIYAAKPVNPVTGRALSSACLWMTRKAVQKHAGALHEIRQMDAMGTGRAAGNPLTTAEFEAALLADAAP